jgi:hypothetical protein
MALFSEAQLADLRTQYAKIHGVDPCGEAYPRMTALLDSMDKDTLKQLAGANVKFLSALARNRVRA